MLLPIVTTIYQTVDQVKVCRVSARRPYSKRFLQYFSQQQCKDLSNRCMTLLLTLRDSPKSMEGTKAMEFTDEVDATITRIHTRVKEWAGLGLLDSVLQSNKIKEGIDRFHRDIDACMMKFNVWISRSLFTMLFTLSRYQSTWNCIEVREIS